ncbi:hypothetical protein C1Y63_11160 [Corynebacterium sp. 13CS0277]|uniref:hypothetical protein n=1 Tax=Corynebacterium sp. 13CS0277 TaxID=2071994 RepID=UPI000D029995|nr:hypothetical protein [Corynebacterium sp. 13CS0277]PRQ10488.1 hypothetical protein C1Y63_11160 [Corynebacterium sp. 13CS0277]
MMKNRIRTAAIAGAVALATSLSGVTVVPALAADNTGNHFNQPDGSAPREGSVKSEAQLKAATDAISKFLVDDQSPRDEIQKRYLETFAYKNAKDGDKEGALSPDEKSVKDAFDAAHADITAKLDEAAQNVANARAAVAAALADDEAARKANVDLDAEFRRIHDAHPELNKLIAAVNKENKTGLANLPLLSVDVNGKSITTVLEVRELLKVKDEHVVNLNNYDTVDESANNYVSRQYMEAFDTLLKNEALNEFQQTLTKKNEAIIQAEKHDVIVLQLALARANAQVQALRVLQASFNTAATFVDLYENDTLFADYKNGWQTLRPEYKAALPELQTAVNDNYDHMLKADEEFTKRFDGFENDEVNSTNWKADKELAKYYAEREALARDNYAQIVNNADWQMIVEKLQLKLAKFGKEAEAAAAAEAEAAAAAAKEAEQARKEAEAAEREAARAAAEARDTALQDTLKQFAAEAAAARAKEQEALNKLAEALKKPAPAPQNNDKKPSSTDNSSDNKFDLKGLGIFAVIAAIIGAIAAALPHIAQFLPKA